MKALQVREVDPSDREAVKALHERSFPDALAFDELVLDNLLRHPSAINLLAEHGDTVVGFLSALHGTSPRARILTVHTAPEARRQGVASHLLDVLTERLRARRADHVELEVHAANDAAIELYRSRGYEIRREDPTAYPSLDDPRGYVMRREL